MKKIVLTAILGVLFTLGFVFYSCESNTYDEISSISNPTYRANISPLFRTTCVSCHSNDSQLPNLDTYEDVKDNIENGILICKIDNPAGCYGGIMPQSGRMPQSIIDMVKLWRDQGFVN